MKDLKFRLRDRFNNIAGYEKWYEGELHSYEDGTKDYIAHPCWLTSEDGDTWKARTIPHRFKDQYTGLEDKNGKEIYEGDILKSVSPKTGMIKVAFVCYIRRAFELAFELYDFSKLSSLGACGWEMSEVIGNIYSNPELLEKR